MTHHCEDILIVDRDDDLRDLLSRSFDFEGYATVGARTIAEAKVILVQHLPDLILVDGDLPDGNGLDLVRDTRRQS